MSAKSRAARRSSQATPFPWERPVRWSPRGRLVRKVRLSQLVLQEKVFPSGSEVPFHDHPRTKICLILAGLCHERRAGREHRYEPWSLQLNPRGSSHTYRAGERGLRVFSVTLGPPWRDREPGSMSELVDDARQASLLTLVSRLYREALRPGAGSGLVAESLLSELLVSVAPVAGSRPPAAPGWLCSVLDLLRDRFHEPHGLSTVAAEVGIHPSHLARTFRAHVGQVGAKCFTSRGVAPPAGGARRQPIGVFVLTRREWIVE